MKPQKVDVLPEYPFVRVGQTVKAAKDVYDDGDLMTDLVAEKGTFGRVVGLYAGHWPAIKWEQTGRVTDCVPGREFTVVAMDVALTPVPWAQAGRR